MKNPNTERKLHPSECPYCGHKSKHIGRRRRSTQYVDDNSNWFLSCRPCFEMDAKYWSELWAEYYAGLL